MSSDVAKHLKSLSFGIMQGSYEQVYKAHHALYNIGTEALPLIEETILKQSWGDVKHGAQIGQLIGMLNLIHDIDEERAKAVGEQIRKSGCSVKVNRRISAITSFTMDNFNCFEVAGVKIYQAKQLGKQLSFERRMKKWLAVVPPEDLAQIERLYLVPKSDSDYLGYYMPILCKIVVEWDMPFSNFNPVSWLFLFLIKKTFYHEIGHHAHRHTFGQDPDQEKEADRYAAKLLFKSHPLFVGTLKKIIGIFVKPKKAEEPVT